MNNTLTAIDGIKVGHATDLTGVTGCTVVICPPKTVAGVDVRGGAPGTRETDLLSPHNHVEEVSAVVLSGGSAFGLATADGVMRYLKDNKMGYVSGMGYIVPIVPTAILFDLLLGEQDIYPTADMGYQAAKNATSDPVEQGCVGAGTGAVCGAIFGKEFATKSGIGSASITLANGLTVAALVAVNAVGDVLDENNEIMAGVRRPPEGDEFLGMLNAMENFADYKKILDERQNTVIGIVASNAKLSKAHTNKVAQMAHDGIARAINPAHTMFDGDTIFALSTGQIETDATFVGAHAANVMSNAIRNAVRSSNSLDGVKAYNE